MAFLDYEQVVADGTIKDNTALTIPALANWAMIQADTENIRYTLDGTTHPVSGKRLIVGLIPEMVLIQDLKLIRFYREGGSNGNLNIHYGG